MNSPIHTHFCPDCNSQFQCVALGCAVEGQMLCPEHYDEAVGFPLFDPEAEYQAEEVRGVYDDK